MISIFTNFCSALIFGAVESLTLINTYNVQKKKKSVQYFMNNKIGTQM